MESEHEGMMIADEAQFSQVFGDDTGTDIYLQSAISHIMNNEPAMVDLIKSIRFGMGTSRPIYCK